jgi:hypothetical protein
MRRKFLPVIPLRGIPTAIQFFMTTNNPDNNEDKVLCEWCLVKEAVGKFIVPGKGIFYLCEYCRRLTVAFPAEEQ